MRLIFLSFAFFACRFFPLLAQLPQPCPSAFTPSVTCADACVFCNFDGYSGSTVGFPAVKVPKFCGTGTIENVQWLGFIAGASGATFTITPTACFNGDGVQVALYTDCEADPIACNMGAARNDLTPVSVTAAMTPGRVYYLLIDGFAGDQCEFVIDVSPKEAVFEPALGTPGAITGPNAVCPGSTATYSIAPVSGAGAYIWDGPPGAMIDSMPLPVVLLAEKGEKVQITFGATVGPVCVSAANACKRNAPCAATLPVEELDDRFKPSLKGDTLGYLTCDKSPVYLRFSVEPPGDYRYLWTTDSTGNIMGDSTAARPQIDRPGIYNLLVVNQVTGCFSEKKIRVAPPDIPSAVRLNVQPVRCYGEKNGSIEIADVLGGQEPLMFSIQDAPYSDVQRYDALPAGDYTLRIQTADACLFDTLVAVTTPDDWILQLGQDTSLELGQALPLWRSDQISDAARIASFDIQPDSLRTHLLCDTCPFRPLRSFAYALTARDSNGCTAADEKMVIVSKPYRVFIPSAFAPDSDRSNALLTVQGGSDVVAIERFSVFNRWGNLMYEARQLPPDSATGWDGSYNGKKVDPGVFICRAEVLFLNGEKEVYTQSVTMVR
jgi:gliding motility-associated-like protein